MKLLIVFSSLLFVTYAQIDPTLLNSILAVVKQMGGQCRQKIHGYCEADIEPLKTHNLPITRKGKCFLACLYEQAEFFDCEGRINPYKIKSTIELLKGKDDVLYGQLKQVADTCTREVKNQYDKCDTALEVLRCSERVKKEVGIQHITLEL